MGYIEDLRDKVGHDPVILTGAVVVITNHNNQILLQQRQYPKGKWGLPGGLMELKESVEETARREVLEETSLVIEHLELLGIVSGEQCYCKAENGDEFYVVTIGYHSSNPKGNLVVDHSESISCDYYSLDQLPNNIAKTHLKIIDMYKEKVKK